MLSLFRFYKNIPVNIEALSVPYIFLFSAAKWEADGEFDFQIDIGSDEDYKGFLIKKLEEGFSLKPTDPGYNIFKQNRIEKLKKYNKSHLLNSNDEYDFLLEALFKEAKSEITFKERYQVIKENFYSRSGISCFTKDNSSVENELYWSRFAANGDGFCVEYNYNKLHDYFLRNNIKVAGEDIKYTSTKPVLKFPQGPFEETEKTYKEIIFSLKQSLHDENEFRFATIYREDLSKDDTRRKVLIPSDIISSITIGYRVTTETEDLIKSILKKNIPHAILYKITEQHDLLYRHRVSLSV